MLGKRSTEAAATEKNPTRGTTQPRPSGQVGKCYGGRRVVGGRGDRKVAAGCRLRHDEAMRLNSLRLA